MYALSKAKLQREKEWRERGERERIEQVREQEMDLLFVASLPSGYKGQVWLV